MKPFRILLCLFAIALGQVPCALGQGTAFTYQGLLTSSNSNVSGSYDMTFTLFNASSGGAQVGSTITDTAISISNGLFTVVLDFGSVFTGSACWLEIGVRSNGIGSFATLAPRQQLTPTPYAITAENLDSPLPASQLTGTLGPALFPTPLDLNGSTAAALLQANQAGSGSAIFGSQTATTGTNAGVQGTTASTATSASAVYGLVNSTSPGALSAAVRGQNNGTGIFGVGVYGSQAGSGSGVYGTTPGGVGVYGNTSSGTGVEGDSSSAIGVAGFHTALTGTAPGVQGTTASTDVNATAVYGRATSLSSGFASAGVRGDNFGTNGLGIGVYGSQASSGWGVYGYAPAGIGVYGQTTTGTGVEGSSTGGDGVYGSSFSSNSVGVFGAHLTNGTGAGVQGTTISIDPNANAVYGLVSSTSPGAFSAAVRGENDGTNGAGIGVYGSHASSGWGGYFTSVSGVGVYAVSGTGMGVLGSSSAGDGINGNSFSGSGVYGSSSAGYGISGSSSSGSGVYGTHTSSSGTNAGVQGTTASTEANANAVYGLVSSTAPGGNSAAVRGQNNGSGFSGIGVYGSQAGNGWGVYGTTPSGIGVSGGSTTGTGVAGSSSSGPGVYGFSSTGSGVYAYSGTGPALTIANGAIQVQGAGVATSTAAFVHVATTNNSYDDVNPNPLATKYITVITNRLCDGNPNAILIVTPNSTPPGSVGQQNNETNVYSLWYAQGHWQIYHTDVTSIVGQAFNVLVTTP